MSTPYPPPPRRLMRDPNKKLIGGVCAGLAKYLNMDVNLVRILAVVITLFTGIPIVLYLIALFVMPEEGATPPQPPYVNGPQPVPTTPATRPVRRPAAVRAPAQPPVDQVWGPGGAPWEQPQTRQRPRLGSRAGTAASCTHPSAPEPTSSPFDQDPATQHRADTSSDRSVTSTDRPLRHRTRHARSRLGDP